MNSNGGVALDVDETLAWTVGHLFELMQIKFGNPHPILSVERQVEKYRYTWNVPIWDTYEARKWIEQQMYLEDFFIGVKPISDSAKYVEKIGEIVPLSSYLLSRHDQAYNATKEWLSEHGFPELPIILRDEDNRFDDQYKWKADVLCRFRATILGLVDDDLGVLEYLPSDYKGQLFFLGHEQIPETQLNAHACPDWKAVYRKIKQVFSK